MEDCGNTFFVMKKVFLFFILKLTSLINYYIMFNNFNSFVTKLIRRL